MLTLTYRRGRQRLTGSLIAMPHAIINVPMDGPRCSNIFGAFAHMFSDDIVRATSSRAPEAGPAASALALLAHEPGLSIRTLAIGVGLSHAGTVRLVARLVAEGLVERQGPATDRRASPLSLPAARRREGSKVLPSGDRTREKGLTGS